MNLLQMVQKLYPERAKTNIMGWYLGGVMADKGAILISSKEKIEEEDKTDWLCIHCWCIQTSSDAPLN